MSWNIQKDESDSTLRTIHFRLFTSNGTAPDTGASGDSIMLFRGISNYTCDGPVSATSAAAGMYFAVLSQSNVSVLGPLAAWHWQGDFAQHVANVQVVNNNHYSTQSNLDLSTKTVLGVSGRVNSSVTIANAEYSAVTVRIGLVAYSGATVGAGDLAPGAYSGVTIQGLSNYANISNVTLHAGTHSGATVQGLSNYANISNVTLHAGVHSGATVGVGSIAPGIYSGVSVEVKSGGIQASSHGAGAFDAAAFATDAVNEIADGLLGRNVAGGSSTGRLVKQAFYVLRNRVELSGLTGTVYDTDDSTSAFTFSIATVAAQAISAVDPGGV